MKNCSVCKKPSSVFLLNNKFVCFHCDELLFDIEIESDEAEIALVRLQPAPTKPEGIAVKPTGHK